MRAMPEGRIFIYYINFPESYAITGSKRSLTSGRLFKV